MKSSVKIGSIAGIGIFLHWTFLLLIAGIFAFYLLQGNSVSAALIGVGLVGTVFVCVVLHELGHALTARRYDVPTRDITLYPIGGVARLQRIPEEPMKEFWIAVAGPAVNVLIALALFLVIQATGASLSPEAFVDPTANFLGTLMWLNIVLVGFNLLPAFPMDGGRVLRALLAVRMDYARATQIAANVGQGMAILFGIVGLIGFNPILLFIALFVYIGAQQEAQQAMMRTITEGVPVRQAMMTRFATLSPEDTLAHAVDELIAGSDQDFPIVDGGNVVGVLTRRNLLKAISERGRDAAVADFVDPSCLPIDATAMLQEAFQRMSESKCSTIPVVHRGKLVGLLTLENVGELMMVSSALKKSGSEKDVAALVSSDR